MHIELPDPELTFLKDTHMQNISKEESPNYVLAVAHAEMNSRRRNTMEDCHRILPRIDDTLPLYSFFAIYDGHGGRQIVDYLESGLETNLVKEIQHPDEASLGERITRAFLITDMESRKLDINTSGATAVIALLFSDPDHPEGRKLFVANVGDSRAVLAVRKTVGGMHEDESESDSGFIGKRLTFDHRAEDKGEQARISQAGGFVTRNRVLGILAVSRSFGDHGMKDFVIATPHLSEIDISSKEEMPFLILACDGVWDVISDQEAVDLLLPRYLENGPDEEAARLLVDTALERGSADNITAIVVYF